MFYFQKRVTEERGVREIQEQRMTIEAAQPMVDYITQCLDIWALRGLELLGQQGGVIFQSQGEPFVGGIGIRSNFCFLGEQSGGEKIEEKVKKQSLQIY